LTTEPTPSTPVACDGLISPNDFAADLGVTQPLSFGASDGGVSIEFSGAAHVGETRCFLNVSGSDEGVGVVDVLPGAAWAAPTNISVAGLAAGELSTIRVNPSTGEVVVDFTLHGEWVEVSIYSTSDGGLPVSGDLRSKLAAIAAKIVQNLSAR
jgi:hypothetical protein